MTGSDDETHAADLALARAALAGDAAALRELDRRVLAAIDPAVRRIDRAPAFVDEVRQALRVRLLVAEAGEAPRLASYAGRGPLVAWARVAAVRLALNLRRARRPALALDEILGELASAEPDAETRHLKTMYRAEFAEAFRAALAGLPERSRALLRLHHVDGLRLARIGVLYGVHESTVSRWVRQAAEAVSEDARRRLHERLGLSPGSVDSIARAVQSNLDLSIRRLLEA